MRLLTVMMGVLLLTSVTVGQAKKAPDFTLKTSEGATVQLSKLKGKVVLVNFWATWCGPCRKEIPDFLEIYKKYKERGFEIVGIALDDDGWNIVNPFVKKFKIEYPIVIGNGSTVKDYGSFEYIPATFLIDRNGNIVHEFTGLVTQSVLERKLKDIL